MFTINIYHNNEQKQRNSEKIIMLVNFLVFLQKTHMVSR